MSGLFKISIASTGRRSWKDTFYVTAEISTEGHFLSPFCQLMVVECVPCTLLFCSLFSVFFFFPSLRVLFCVGWLADRGWSVTQPSRPSRTLWYLPPPSSLLSACVSVDTAGLPRGAIAFEKTFHSDPKVNSSRGSRGLKKMLWKRMPENFLIKLEASTQWSVACQQCTP